MFIGSNTGKNADGSSNVFIGYASGYNNGGNRNLFAGMDAGYNSTNGSHNIFLGFRSGYLATGSSNVFIGHQVGYNETGSNKLYIDNSSTSSPLIYGDFSSNIININGKLGIGRTPTEELELAGDILINNGAFISSQSGQDNNVDHLWHDDNPAGDAGGTWHFSSDQGYKVAGNSRLQAGHIHMTKDTDNNFIAGNLGIGTESPSFKLDVSGDIRANGGDLITQGDRGLKNNSDGTYFFSDNTNYWRSRSDRGIIIANRANAIKGQIFHNNANGFGLMDGDGNWALRIERDAYTSFRINNSEKMRILTSGNVGIGTTTPQYKLDVNGGFRATDLIISGNLSMTGGGVESIFLSNDDIEGVNKLIFADPGIDEGLIWNTTAAKLYVSPLNGGAGDGYLRMINDGGISFEAGAENTEDMVITAAGDVGIGTTNPSSKFHVRSDNRSTSSTNDPIHRIAFFEATHGGADASIAIKGVRNGSLGITSFIDFDIFDNNEAAQDQYINMARIGAGKESVDGQNGQLRFFTNNGGSLGERMRIMANGNVGIGTTTPDVPLSIVGSIQANRTDAETDYIRMGVESIAGDQIGFFETSGNKMDFRRSSDGMSFLEFNENGDFLVDSKIFYQPEVSDSLESHLYNPGTADLLFLSRTKTNNQVRFVEAEEITNPWILRRIHADGSTCTDNDCQDAHRAVASPDTVTIASTQYLVDILDLYGNLSLGSGAYIDDEDDGDNGFTEFGLPGDDWINLNGYIGLSSSDPNHGIKIFPAETSYTESAYANIGFNAGKTYLSSAGGYDLYFIEANNRDVTFGGDLTMSATSTTNLSRVSLANNEHLDGNEGDLYFDLNVWGNENDFSTHFTGGNGGAIAYKGEEGWGALLATNNMEFITAKFDGLEVTNDANITGEITTGGDGTSENWNEAYTKRVTAASGLSWNNTSKDLSVNIGSGLTFNASNQLEIDQSAININASQVNGWDELNGVLTYTGTLEATNAMEAPALKLTNLGVGDATIDRVMMINPSDGTVKSVLSSDLGSTSPWGESNGTVSYDGDANISGAMTTGTLRLSGLLSGNTFARVLMEDGSGNLGYKDLSSFNFSHWNIDGSNNLSYDAGTITSTQGIYSEVGASDLALVVKNGTTTNFKVDGSGNIRGRKLELDLQSSWPDYVFKDDYKLRTLEEVETYVKANNHLPDVPSEADVRENGIDVAEMESVLLQKVEELTLYIIEQNKTIKSQQEALSTQQEKLSAQQEKLSAQQEELKQQKEDFAARLEALEQKIGQ